MEAASTSRLSLGEYFVEKGLITQADLERAHAEHLTTKRRLADILVKRGLVTGTDITNALMDQLGMAQPSAPPAAPLEPDSEAPGAEPEEQRPQPELTLVPPADDPWPGEVDVTPWPGETAVDETPAPWPGEIDFDSWPGGAALGDHAAAASPALAEPHVPTSPAVAVDPGSPVALDAEAWQTGPWDVPPAVDEPAAEAEIEPAPVDEPVHEATAARSDNPLPDVHAMIAERHRELCEALATATQLTTRASELQAEIDELVTQASAAAAVLVGSVELDPSSDSAPPSQYTPEKTGAVFLVPRPDRFELVEIDLEAPAVGETVDLGDRRYVVTKIASSPLPFDRRSCAVLAETSETV